MMTQKKRSTKCIILLLFLLFSQIKIGGGGTLSPPPLLKTKVFLTLIITKVKIIRIQTREFLKPAPDQTNIYKDPAKNILILIYTDTARLTRWTKGSQLSGTIFKSVFRSYTSQPWRKYNIELNSYCHGGGSLNPNS